MQAIQVLVSSSLWSVFVLPKTHRANDDSLCLGLPTTQKFDVSRGLNCAYYYGVVDEPIVWVVLVPTVFVLENTVMVQSDSHVSSTVGFSVLCLWVILWYIT